MLRLIGRAVAAIVLVVVVIVWAPAADQAEPSNAQSEQLNDASGIGFTAAPRTLPTAAAPVTAVQRLLTTTEGVLSADAAGGREQFPADDLTAPFAGNIFGIDAVTDCEVGVSVYSQPVHMPGDSWSAGFTDADSIWTLYDNFTCDGPLTGIRFWGIRASLGDVWSNCDEDPMSFIIRFYEDDSGYPELLLETRTVTVYAEPTGLSYASFELVQYEVAFDPVVDVTEGWISIRGTEGPSCIFAWMSGSGADGHSWHYDGSIWTDRFYDQAFCLLSYGCPEYAHFSQPPSLPTGTSNMYTSDDGPPEQYCVYDNFAPVDWIGGIRFWGIHGSFDGGWSPCEEVPMTFAISFYTDNAGEPDYKEITVTTTLTGIPTGMYYLGGVYQLYEYSTSLPPCKPIHEPGWVSIQALGEPDCWFLWCSTRDGLGDHCWQWDGSTMLDRPEDMAFCILDTPPCCGRYTDPMGYTGNANCDDEGKRNLADISKLIDRVYLTKVALCCEPNGNVNGDIEDKINLADISKLIDHVYLTKAQTAACQ